MNFIEFLGWVVFFYITWQLLKSWILVQNIKHRLAETVEKEMAVQQVERRVLALRFEHVEENGHSVVLAYGKNNKFLGQGLTEDEAEKNIQLYYPQHKILVVNEKATITKILDPLDAKSI